MEGQRLEYSMYTEFKHGYKHTVLWKCVCIYVYEHTNVYMYTHTNVCVYMYMNRCKCLFRGRNAMRGQCIKKLRHHFA